MFKKATKLAAAAVITFASINANSAGFALYEFSARGNAMGGAVMANKAEPASIATNPALITELEGTQVQAGLTVVLPEATATFANSNRDVKSEVFALPNVYVTHQGSERVYFGLGIFSRFGLGGEYDGDITTWPGSSVAYKFGVETFSFTPEIAVKASEELSLSMGLEVMQISFNEHKYISNLQAMNPALPPISGHIKIKGDGTSWGGNFGLLYKPEWAPKWGFGASYKAKVRHVVDGNVNVNSASDFVNQAASYDALGSVTLPDSIHAGLSFQATDKLVLETGIVGTFWSSYDAIRIENISSGALSTEYKKYKDVVRFNIGGEYSINDIWDVRLGYVFDQAPTNGNYMDTLVPVADRHLFNLGAGWKKGAWGVDASYTYLLGKDMKGTYSPYGADVEYTNGASHMFGLSARYSFN